MLVNKIHIKLSKQTLLKEEEMLSFVQSEAPVPYHADQIPLQEVG